MPAHLARKQNVTDPIAALHRSLGIPPDYAASRDLELQPEAIESDLIAIATADDGRKIRLTGAAASAWHRLHVAAETDGVLLVPLSGFRSVARQAEIIRGKLASGRSLADILRTVAMPGYSEHHTGRALDIGTPGDPPLEESFANTAAFAWLVKRGAEFGFTLSYPRDNRHGIAFEPWHWLHRG